MHMSNTTSLLEPQLEIIQPSVKMITATPDAEKLIAYCARVSNPANQNNEKIEKLLAYCIKNHHWSVFETASVTFEITTSRAISAQILRHRSATFQEFSQRYAVTQSFQPIDVRLQDTKNRQNSVEVEDQEFKSEIEEIYYQSLLQSQAAYQSLLDKGVAKEVARFVLPMASTSVIYMTNNVRNWIHYLDVRAFGEGVQKEHRVVALNIAKELCELLPTTALALDWENRINEAKTKFGC